MILRRLAESLHKQDWFVVVLEILIVVVGIFIGLQVDDWNEARKERARGDRVIQAIRDDLHDRIAVQARFRDAIIEGLAAWEESRAQGQTPPPFYFRIAGSETPPSGLWEIITQEGLVDLMDTNLLFDLGFYYGESRGIGLRYVRYAEFTEAEILPWLGEADETEHFYDNGTTLKPMFRAHMERLREYGDQLLRTRAMEDCLLQRLEAPQTATQSCRDKGTMYSPR